jgi:hypothetical protein
MVAALAKRILAICFLLAASLGFAYAAEEGPITSYFAGADTIYLVRVDSMSGPAEGDGGVFKGGGSSKFIVEETLKGSPVPSVMLTPGIIDIQKGSEFLILSSKATRSGQMGDVVGSLFKGNVGWQDAPVVRDAGQIYVFVWPSGDKVINGQSYITLDHAKQLIKQDAGK